MEAKFSKEPFYYVTDVVLAKHPETNEEAIGEIDSIAKNSEKPYLVYFQNGSDNYFSADELQKAPLTSQVMYLKEEMLNARNQVALAHAGYDCLLWDSNVLQDRVLGLIKKFRTGVDLSEAIRMCEQALGGREVVDHILANSYSERDYNYS